jgi:ferritin
VLIPEIEKLLNEQIVNEFYSAHLYLAMSAWLRGQNLDGFAQWFYVQYKEELDHGLIIYNYVLQAGGTAKVATVDAPPQEFDSLADVLQRSLKHEQLVTARIYQIVETADAAKDFKTVQFLNWFVAEQVEEEDNLVTALGRLKNFGGDAAGL